jgi:hypothetical protein
MNEGWKPGPLPPNTYHWGGVQLKGEEGRYSWHFADFRGDHVILPAEGGKRVEKDDIILFNNAIHCPNTTFGQMDTSGGGPELLS